MSQEMILLPALALGFWTFSILVLIPFRRIRARNSGAAALDDFALGESANVPADAVLVNRNYMNLLEMPIVFYVASLMLYVTGAASTLSLVLCWAYVGARIGHTLVHLIYNNVIHRVIIFAISNLLLLTLWIHLTSTLLALS